MEPPAPKTESEGSQTKAAKQGWELLFPLPDERMALRGSRNEGSGGGGSDRIVSGGGPSSKQSPTQAAILDFPPRRTRRNSRQMRVHGISLSRITTLDTNQFVVLH